MPSRPRSGPRTAIPYLVNSAQVAGVSDDWRIGMKLPVDNVWRARLIAGHAGNA